MSDSGPDKVAQAKARAVALEQLQHLASKRYEAQRELEAVTAAIRRTLIGAVRDGSLSGREAAEVAGISRDTLYAWLRTARRAEGRPE